MGTVGRRFGPAIGILAVAAGSAWTTAGSADEVALAPVRDATIFSLPVTGANAGGNLYVGRTAQSSNRRALLRFDVSGLPAGSTIQNVTLTLRVSRSILAATPVRLYRLGASWTGTGTANGAGPGGGQAEQAVTGDVTWLHRSYDTLAWASAGGDFSGGLSAQTNAGASATAPAFSGPGMVADVVAWVEGTAENFGWILIGDEQTSQSAVQFYSVDSAISKPALVITYTPPAPDPDPEPEPDNDGDGIADAGDNCPADANPQQENFDGDAQGDACDPDDDNDGLPDAVEIANMLDPLDPADANGDADADGFSNLQEFLAGTDIRDPQSHPSAADTKVDVMLLILQLLLDD